MAILYVAEYDSLLIDSQGNVVLVPKDPPLAEQVVAIGVSSTPSANPFSSRTRFVQIGNDAVCSIAFGKNPTATISNQRLPANSLIFKGVNAGDYIAVISNT